MRKSEDLKSILERLKAETSYIDDPSLESSSRPVQPQLSVKPVLPAMTTNTVGHASVFNRGNLKNSQVSAKFNSVWSENKESLLFCILSSICVILIGVFSQKEYVILAGTISFILFSVVSFAAFFRYISASSSTESFQLLPMKSESRRYYANSSISVDKERELEGKIEELRSIVKALSREQGKNI